MLEISNITKQYPTPRGPLTVLSGVSLKLERGEAAAVTGPSGSGTAWCERVARRSRLRRQFDALAAGASAGTGGVLGFLGERIADYNNPR